MKVSDFILVAALLFSIGAQAYQLNCVESSAGTSQLGFVFLESQPESGTKAPIDHRLYVNGVANSQLVPTWNNNSKVVLGNQIKGCSETTAFTIDANLALAPDYAPSVRFQCFETRHIVGGNCQPIP